MAIRYEVGTAQTVRKGETNNKIKGQGKRLGISELAGVLVVFDKVIP